MTMTPLASWLSRPRRGPPALSCGRATGTLSPSAGAPQGGRTARLRPARPHLCQSLRQGGRHVHRPWGPGCAPPGPRSCLPHQASQYCFPSCVSEGFLTFLHVISQCVRQRGCLKCLFSAAVTRGIRVPPPPDYGSCINTIGLFTWPHFQQLDRTLL